MTDATYDVVLRGGRVIDPDTELDAVADVGITGDRIAAVSTTPLPAGVTDIDATGLVVAPGFIDLHSHAHSIAGLRLQAFDGVTTALELEAGITPVGKAYDLAAAEGRPLNYGFSSSWAIARMQVLAGAEGDGRLTTFLHRIGDPAWQRPAGPDDVARILDAITADLAAGALGIGVLVGYAPLVDPAEYTAVARLAAAAGVPTYTHARELVETVPDTPVDGPTEVVRAAADTGAHMHYCHIHSTSRRHVDRVLELVARAQREGSRVTTEAYPYGSGMTGIGATFLDPDKLGRWGLTPSSITYAPTGERVADAARLRELRAGDPGGLAIIDFFDEDDPADRAMLTRALAFDDTIVASDAMPLTWRGDAPDAMTWPVPRSAVTHPRTAGTFARALRLLVRDTAALALPEALRRCSLLPAQVLEASVPAMRRKGRVQPGCDADLVVFDAATISDQATYTDSTRVSTGVHHLLVHGTPVVRDEALVEDALPGRAVRAASGQ